jgi:hypothetical protein
MAQFTSGTSLSSSTTNSTTTQSTATLNINTTTASGPQSVSDIVGLKALALNGNENILVIK